MQRGILFALIGVTLVGQSESDARLRVAIKAVEGSRGPAVEVRIENMLALQRTLVVSAALYLLPVGDAEDTLPNRMLWGPVDPNTGFPFDLMARRDESGRDAQEDPWPVLHLEARESRSVTINLSMLKWSLAILSVWPYQPLKTAASPGEYWLWFEVDVLDPGREGEESESVTSPRLKIFIGR